MKRIISGLILLTVLACLSFASGQKDAATGTPEPGKAAPVVAAPVDTAPAALRAAALVGPSGIGMAYLFGNPPDLGGGTVVTFEAAGSVDVMLPKLLKGELDIGILPPNVAAKLYNLQAGSVVLGAVVGNGMISLVTRDDSVKTLADLAGKTVSVVGQGATPEYVMRTLLEKSGLAAGSVILDYSIPATEIGAALIGGKIGYALVPEPFATIAVMNGASGDKPVRRAILLRDAWKANGLGDDFPMTVCVIRTDYAKQHPGTVRKFLEAYRASIAWTVANPVEAGQYVEKAALGLKAPIAAKAIPASNYVFMTALEGRTSVEKLLSVFLGMAPEAIGGKLPDEGFYFK